MKISQKSVQNFASYQRLANKQLNATNNIIEWMVDWVVQCSCVGCERNHSFFRLSKPLDQGRPSYGGLTHVTSLKF